ncbi:MAG: sulfatase-like hydrolase/transferase [Flavobacteriaceae bacterium]
MKALYLFLLICSWPLVSQSQNAHEKPNFILIVADDLGYGDLSLTGSAQIKTPNIDDLAKNGTFFTQGYVSSAVCSPSRAGFITGINQVEFGHDNNIANNQPGFDPDYRGLPLTVQTIADHLKPLGYVSGLIGKWHLGYEPQFHPLKRGFDEFWGYIGGSHDYFKALPNVQGMLSAIECNYKTPQPLTYITDDKGNECVDFIKRHKNEPFFLYASFNAPHTPMQATEADLALYAHIEDTKRRTYAAMVHRLDINVGKILNALKTEGLDQNTLVVFISDNGGPTGINGSINAPYTGKKGTLLEGGIHIPYIMSWPSTIPRGEVYANPVSALDFAPTFMALAGGNVSAVPFSGVNLMPFITEKSNTEKPHEQLKWRFTISAAIQQDNWKLIRLPDRLPLLYHLANDPSEQNNLALKHLDKTEALLKMLGDWDVSLPHPVFMEGAEWKKIQLKQYNEPYQITQPKD